jgi:hypothetical protein
MKSLNPFRILAIIIAFIFSSGLSAQETTVSIKVKKDGKVVKDTIYSFENEEQAENALKIMEVMCAGDEHTMEIHKTISESHEGHSKTMVFISEDGKTTQIEESSGDSLVWITEGEHHGDNVKVTKHEVKGGDDFNGEHVVVVKSDDGETYHIFINEEREADPDGENTVKTKEVKVVISSDEGSEWSVKEVDDMKVDSEKEDVEVIVVEKKVKK